MYTQDIPAGLQSKSYNRLLCVSSRQRDSPQTKWNKDIVLFSLVLLCCESGVHWILCSSKRSRPGAEFSQENVKIRLWHEPKKSRGDRGGEEKRLLFRKYFIVLTGDTTPWWFPTMLWSHAICSYLATPSWTKACLPECLRGSACLEEYSWDLVHTIVSALSNLSPTPPYMVSRSLHHPCLLSSLSSAVY